MVRSHTQELLSAPRLRNACDRCHAQKLRCLRPPSGTACLRCIKFASPCVYSARTTRRRKKTEEFASAQGDVAAGGMLSAAPAASTALTTSQILEPPTQIPPLSFPDFDLESAAAWPMFPDQEINYGLLDLSQFPCTQEPVYPVNTPSPSSLLPTDIFSQPPTIFSSTPTISDLNTHLLTQQAHLPHTLSNASPHLRILALDQIFSLTRAFIHAVQSISYPLSSHPGANDGDNSTVDTDANTDVAYGSSLTALLAIYTALFDKMRACAGNPDAVVNIGDEVDVELAMPVMRFGGYVPRKGFWGNDAGRGRGGGGRAEDGVRQENTMRGYAMQYMMLVMLCTRLCEELREAVEPVGRGTLGMQFVGESVEDAEGGGFGDGGGGGIGGGWRRLEDEMKRTKEAALVFVGGCL